MTYIVISIPCSNKKEAEIIAKSLIQQKLVACTNISPITSFFNWDNKLNSANEYLILAKSKANLFKSVEKYVKLKHSYDCPCILAWDLTHINKQYKDWLDQQLK